MLNVILAFLSWLGEHTLQIIERTGDRRARCATWLRAKLSWLFDKIHAYIAGTDRPSERRMFLLVATVMLVATLCGCTLISRFISHVLDLGGVR